MSAERTLFRTFLRWLLLPLLGLLLLGAILAYGVSLRTAMKVLDLGLYDNALDLSKQIQNGPQGWTINLPPAALRMLQENNDDRVIYAAWDDSGHVFSGDPGLRGMALAASPQNPEYADLFWQGEQVRAIFFDGRKEAKGPYHIAVAQTLHARNRLLDGILASILLPASLLTLTAAGVVVLASRRTLSPVHDLRAEILQRSSSDLRPLPEDSAPLELRAIIHGVNLLLQNLAHSFADQRRFIADAAHQLRTPLASLSGQIELALERPPADVQRWLRDLLITTRRTTHLAHQLLSLARWEHTEQSMIEHTQVELEQVCREAAAQVLEPARAKQVELVFELEPLEVRGSAWMLQELLVNLLDNAIRYSPAGAQVTISVAKLPGYKQGSLKVQDAGPGVPASEWPKLSTPFHRAPGDQTQGCGLGLAIVSEIARLHGAEVLFSPGLHQQGLGVEIRFPAGVERD